MAGFDRPLGARWPRSLQGGGVVASEGGSGRVSSPKRRNILWRFRRVLFLFALIMMAGFVGVAAFVSRLELTDPEELHQSSYICAGGLEPGECTAENAVARLSNADDRVFVPLDEIPDNLKNAVIAAEDRNFYEHKGVSPQAIARAVYQDLRGGATQGGSTITQQYVKNAYLTHEQTVDRKVREALLAMKLEQQLSKDEILESYLNTIYFGRNSLGVQAASQLYFGKDVQNIELHEAALLAGVIRAPTYGDPDEYEDEAKRRRETVLEAMYEEGYITEGELDEANADDFESVTPYEGHSAIRTFDRAKSMGSEYVTVYVQQELEEMGYSEQEISGGGLRVHTTLNLELQSVAYNVIYGPEGLLNQEEDPAAALVSLDHEGRVLAMVGGKDFRGEGESAQVDLARSGRPVGSTFKGIAVAAAVQDGYSLLNTTYNAPNEITIKQEENGQQIQDCLGEWELKNYSETDRVGRLDLLEATKVSSNTVFAQLMMGLTPTRVRKMAKDLGMDSELKPCGSTVLGSDDSTPLEMAEVYSVFANRGMHHEPQIITRVEITDPDGGVRTDWEWEPEGRRVMTEPKADLVTHALRGVVEDGTGKAAQLDGIPGAGKTGTTSSNKDALFLGYTPQPGITTSVWMGYVEADWVDPNCDPNDPEETRECGVTKEVPPMNENGRPVRGGSVAGGGLPAEIWHNYMAFAVEMLGLEGEFTEPTDQQLRDGLTLENATPGNRPEQGPGNGRPNPDGQITPPTPPPDGRPGQTSITVPDRCDINPNWPGCEPDDTLPDTTSTTDPNSTTSTTDRGGGGPPTSWPPILFGSR